MSQSIPLVVVLWQDANFRGYKRQIITDINDLEYMSFNDTTSAIGIHHGPNYDEWIEQYDKEPTASFYTENLSVPLSALSQ